MQVHGGDIYGREGIVDFSSNINPLGIPDSAIPVLKNIDLLTCYPDEENRDITRNISEYMGVKCENVMVGNGLSEVIHIIIAGLGIKRPIIIGPTFDEYRLASLAHGASPTVYYLKEEHDFEPDKVDLNGLDYDAVFICNPNNPTGVLYDREVILDLIGQARGENAYVIVDEAFMEFCFEMSYTMTEYISEYTGLIVLRAATKFFGMPGLRLGYAFSSKEVISKLKRVQPSWPLNAFASRIGPIFSDTNYINRTREWINEERPYMAWRLKRIKKIYTYPSCANFFMIRLDSITSTELKARMIEKGFLIRDLSNIPGLDTRFVRIAVKDRGLNEQLLIALEETLNG